MPRLSSTLAPRPSTRLSRPLGGRLGTACATAFALLAAASIAACAGDAKSPVGGGDAKTHEGAEHFYPLDSGLMWTFVLHIDRAADGMLSTQRVSRRDAGGANLMVADRPLQLIVTAEGIAREPGGAYLLRVPFKQGDKWPGLAGGTVEVTRVDASVTVDAGVFSGCVETTETHGEGLAVEVLKTTYCPEVGPTLMESFTPGATETSAPRHIVGKLRSYGLPVDLDGHPLAPH